MKNYTKILKVFLFFALVLFAVSFILNIKDITTKGAKPLHINGFNNGLYCDASK